MAFGDTIVATVLGAPSTPTDSDGAANTIAEGAAVNTTVGVTASSTANGSAVTYSLIGDTSGGGFKIDPNTGVMTVADPSKIDFESAPGHAYTITTQASNGFSSPTTQTFTINVNDVAPSAPVDSNAAANTVLEGAANGTAVGVTASSTDVNGGAVTYSLIGDTSGGGFTINSTTGVITVADATKINYESATAHAVTAQASDGVLTSSQTFTIAVTDVAPSNSVDINGAANTVVEGAANGSTVGITAFASDVNGGPVTYRLIGDSSFGGFAIDSSTGIVTVKDGTKIDYETAPAQNHSHDIIVMASDGTPEMASFQVFFISVIDVPASAPTDINAAANTVAEGAANGSTVGITASSVDINGPLCTYQLIDDADGRFAINFQTGVVTVANGAAIDFETAVGHAYGITVRAFNGLLFTSSSFSIGVTDVAPSTPARINGPGDYNVLEGAANGTISVRDLNEAPVGTDKAVQIAENTTYTFGVADFGFSDPSDSVFPNSLLAVKITTAPDAGEGTLKNNGVTVNAGDSVSAIDIAAGHLVFTPVLNANGSPEATFTFQVQDNGRTSNGGVDLDQSANTFTINVSAATNGLTCAGNLIFNGADSLVVSTNGNDSIDAGHGGNVPLGGGVDNFVFEPNIQFNAPTPAQVTHVADYSAAQGDSFDLSALTSAFHDSGVSDALVVRAVESVSGKFATLQVDHIDPMRLPSAPNWVNVAQLDGAHAGDSVNVLIDNHSVHLAQIHVDLFV
jgi:hypothetical protein